MNSLATPSSRIVASGGEAAPWSLSLPASEITAHSFPSSCVTVECSVMRTNSLPWQLPEPLSGADELIERHRAQNGFIEREGPCFKSVTPTDPLEGLTFMQQMALLRMLNAHGRGIARRIMGAEGCQDTPSFADHRELAAQNLCIRPEGEDFHQLTEEGRTRAKAVMAALCQKYGIHIMMEQRHFGVGTSYRCTCGQWSSGIFGKGGRYSQQRAMNSFYSHVPAETKAEVG